MSIFRLQEHTPDVYPRKSRDFQLLCNLFDCMNGGIKFDIDSIRDITDTDLCNERLLNYLQTKLGFFTTKPLNLYAQRVILKSFPYLIKNKGSKKGIIQAIRLFLRSQGINSQVKIQVINQEIKERPTTIDEKFILNKLSNTYLIRLSMNSKLLDTTVLDELLKYIIPAGYIVEYKFYDTSTFKEEIVNSDTIKIIFVQESLNSGLRVSNDSNDESYNNLPINAVGLSNIADSNTKEAAKAGEVDSLDEVSNEQNLNEGYFYNKVIEDGE